MIKPLNGIRVLELGQLIAGPFAAKTLADFGADVIKVEPPGKGDPLREWRLVYKGTSAWWHVQSRNKKSITLDLRTEKAREIVFKLVANTDVLIENFKPGTLEKWGIGWDALKEVNPRLVMLRVSGYGQTGPYRDLPGFGVIGEAMGGLRHLTGQPGEVPVRVGVSIGDTLAALHGVIGILMALRTVEQHDGKGQVVDVALYESVFNIMESLLPEYSLLGHVRQPAGSSLPGIAPSNAYLCKDGKYVLIAANGDSIFKRLMSSIGREDMANDPNLQSNVQRVKNVEKIDKVIGDWAAQKELADAIGFLNEHKVPAGRVYDAEDIANDPHYRAREMILDTTLDDGTSFTTPGIVPKLSKTPGGIRTEAPKLGEHTEEILKELGLTTADLVGLREAGVI